MKGSRQAWSVLSIIVISLMSLSAPRPSLAHHGEVTSRVNTSGSQGLFSSQQDTTLSLSLNYMYQDMSRALTESRDYDRAALGAVSAHTLGALTRLRLSPSVSVSALIPLTLMELSTPDAPDTLDLDESNSHAWGLGDVKLGLAITPLKTSLLSFTLSGRVSAPTGHYATLDALSVTEVKGDPTGMFSLTRYQALASLGAGAWMSELEGRALINASAAWRVLLSGLARAPLTRTPDDLLWGADLELSVGLARRLTRDLSLSLGVSSLSHTQDEMRAIEESEDESRARETIRAGARRELSTWVALSYTLSSKLSCELNARLPMWQHVEGVQLVEAFASGGGCRWSWGAESPTPPTTATSTVRSRAR